VPAAGALLYLGVGDLPGAPRSRVLLYGGAAAGVSFLTLLVVAWVTHRSLGQRLQDLGGLVERASRGEYLLRAQSTARDEVGALARAFDALLAQMTSLSVSVLDTDRELEHTRRELALKQELAEKAGIIAGQNRVLGDRLRELELLFDTAREAGQLPLEDALRRLCGRAGQALGFAEFAVLLADPRSGQFVVRATFGFPDPAAIEGMAFSPGEGISGTVASTRQELVIPDTSRDPRYLHYKGRHMVDGSFVCLPVLLRDHVLGLFNALRPAANAFSDADVRLLRALADSAALAIGNARLLAQISELPVRPVAV
jgi:GAF domain-containing protein